MRVLTDTLERMERELEDINKKEELNYMDLKIVYRIVDIIKDITTIDAMHKADNKSATRSWEDNLTSKS